MKSRVISHEAAATRLQTHLLAKQPATQQRAQWPWKLTPGCSVCASGQVAPPSLRSARTCSCPAAAGELGSSCRKPLSD